MGLLSSKKKKYVGVSNSKLIPEGEAPQALKDSVTAYISDYAKSNGAMGSSLVDYSNLGIEKSIVQGVKRLSRWVRKPGNYTSVGSTIATLTTLSDIDIQDIVAADVEARHPGEITYYYVNNIFIDYAHLSKQVLIDDKAYDPTKNTLIHEGVELYLEDVVIKTIEEIDLLELAEPSFTVKATPFRVEDTDREYTASNLISSPTFQFDHFTVTAVNKFNIISVEPIVRTTQIDLEGAEVVTEERGEIVVTDNIPTIVSESQEFIDSVALEELVDTTTTLNEDGTSTKVDNLTNTVTENFKCTYTFDATYSNYLFSQNLDWEGLPTDDAVDIIDGITEPKLNTQLAYEFTNPAGEVIVVYETLTDSYVDSLYSEGDLVAFGTFLPNLYFKEDFSFVDTRTDSVMHKESKKYAKKLGFNFNDLCDELRKEVPDQKGIMQTYLKMGVNFNSTDKVDLIYLFGFFRKYFNYADINNLYPVGFEFEIDKEYILNGRELRFKDNILEYLFTVRNISYIRKVGGTHPVGTITVDDETLPPLTPPTSGGFIARLQYKIGMMARQYRFFRKQISETEYEEYRVYGASANNYVKDGKWASSGGDNSHMLIPVDFDVVRTLSGFKTKERFLYNSVYVEFLTFVVKKVKWYQRGFFKVIVFAVSVALSVFLGPAGVTVASVLQAAVVNLVIGLAIEVAIKQLAKILSPSLMKAVAVLVALAGLAYGKFSAAGVKSFSKAFTIMFMKANQFLTVSNQLIKATIVQQGEEFKQKAAEYREKMKSLEDYRKDNYKYITDTNLSYLNEGSHRYEPLVIGESMDTLIARTLNTNPGLLTIDYVHGYVGYIVSLPTVDETRYSYLNEDEETDYAIQ